MTGSGSPPLPQILALVRQCGRSRRDCVKGTGDIAHDRVDVLVPPCPPHPALRRRRISWSRGCWRKDETDAVVTDDQFKLFASGYGNRLRECVQDLKPATIGIAVWVVAESDPLEEIEIYPLNYADCAAVVQHGYGNSAQFAFVFLCREIDPDEINVIRQPTP
jgi:hypothetical protein